jgi:hypothetical protein
MENIIEEDLEFEFSRETAIIEAEMHERLMMEWQEWEEEQKNRKPARIEILTPINKKEEAI